MPGALPNLKSETAVAFDRYVALTEKRNAAELKSGAPFDPNVHIGPRGSRVQQERVLSFISEGRESGGEVVVGGEAPDAPGFFV